MNTTAPTSRPVGTDPRPVIESNSAGAWAVVGARCGSCSRAVAYRWSRCPGCGGELVPEKFTGTGTIWSSTVVHITVGTHVPPYTVAYVDLENGPRVLAHMAGEPAPVGSTVQLIGPSDTGDLRVQAARS